MLDHCGNALRVEGLAASADGWGLELLWMIQPLFWLPPLFTATPDHDQVSEARGTQMLPVPEGMNMR